LSLVGKRSKRAQAGCGIIASNSGSRPKTSTKLQLGFRPRLLTNCDGKMKEKSETLKICKIFISHVVS